MNVMYPFVLKFICGCAWCLVVILLSCLVFWIYVFALSMLESTNSMAVNSHTTLSVRSLTLSLSDLSTDDKAKDTQNGLSSRTQTL